MKIVSDRTIASGSPDFWGVDLVLNQSLPILEAGGKRIGKQSP